MKNTARPAKVIVSADGSGMVSQAGALLLTQVLQVTGLRRRLSEGLGRWRAARAIHDPGKIIADLAVALALGGDCLADVAVLRDQPALFGPVASDPIISRLVSQLARQAPRALTAIRAARQPAHQADRRPEAAMIQGPSPRNQDHEGFRLVYKEWRRWLR